MYGYTNSEELVPTNQGGKFGLNTKAFVTKFEYNPNGGSNGSAGDCMDLTVKIEDREFRRRFFPVSKVYSEGKEGGNEITDTTSEEYKKAFERDSKRLSASICEVVECFVPQADIEKALSTPLNSFKDFALILENLVKQSDFKNTPVDVFIQYQGSIKGDNNKTYLQLPSKLQHVTHGKYIVKSLGTGFKVAKDTEDLVYVNAEGITHPIKRKSWFLDSNFANQIDLSKEKNNMQTSGTTSTTDSSEEGDWAI